MPKVPKKAKSVEKPLNTSLSKMKRVKKKNYQSFSIYIYKLLRSLDSMASLGISRKSMLIMNNFVNDMLEKLATEAGLLVAHGKMKTMGSWEIQSASKLLLPGELSNHANMEGMKAVALFHQSISQRSMEKKK